MLIEAFKFCMYFLLESLSSKKTVLIQTDFFMRHHFHICLSIRVVSRANEGGPRPMETLSTSMESCTIPSSSPHNKSCS